MLRLLALYLVLMNGAGFFGMLRDKRRAVRRLSRTPERQLMAVALLGGSIGSILGMLAFRHKTRHLKFTLGLPLILALQAALAVAIILILR